MRNKKLTAKEQAWILHPICLLWATQLTPFPRQSPGAGWKIFPCKHNFQMAVWVTLHLLWFLQPGDFQCYFSKLPYFQTSSQVVMACSTMLSHVNTILAITQFSYCFWHFNTKQRKTKVFLGHQDITGHKEGPPYCELWRKNTKIVEENGLKHVHMRQLILTSICEQSENEDVMKRSNWSVPQDSPLSLYLDLSAAPEAAAGNVLLKKSSSMSNTQGSR